MMTYNGKWRPDDWINPIGTFIKGIGHGQKWAYEQGATAMLETLRKIGQKQGDGTVSVLVPSDKPIEN